MCAYVCVCSHTYTHTYTHMCTHIYMYILSIYTNRFYIYIYIYIYTYNLYHCMHEYSFFHKKIAQSAEAVEYMDSFSAEG